MSRTPVARAPRARDRPGRALAAVTARARELVPAAGVITDRARLRTYECDGLAHYRVTPALVVIPEDAAQLAGVVRACAEHRVSRSSPAARAPGCPAARSRTRTACWS